MSSANKKLVAGVAAWVGLTSYVVGIDYALFLSDNMTLSETLREGMKHPLTRLPVVAAWAVVTAHLFCPPGAKIKKYDPITRLGSLVAK